MPTVQLSRDPFSRATLMRESVRITGNPKSCAWCGQSKPTLYRYFWQSDGVMSRPGYLPTGWQHFCSVGCWRSYTS